MIRHVGHIQLTVGIANVSFYTELYESLGWDVLVEDDGFTGVRKLGWSIWFTPGGLGTTHDHDAVGLNHLGIEAETVADVDRVAKSMKEQGIELLYGTPVNRPEFAAGDDDLYYSVMFQSPDRILLEIVYTGPKIG